MKFTSFLLLIFCLQAGAKGLGQTLTINEQSTSIEKVFRIIHDQTGYDFLYNTLSLKKAKPVSVKATNASLTTVLDLCFEGQPFSYQIIKKTIVVSEAAGIKKQTPAATIAELPVDITGKVVDEDGQPLAGVSIGIKGSNKGTTTKEDGQFSLSVPDANSTLVFSSVGFEKQELSLNGNTSLMIRLKKANADLSNVVVVGYGKNTRQNLTSSITTLKSGDLNVGAITDVGQLMQGKVAGMNITASGDPNRPAAIVLRGASTLNSSQAPFYVIDGIPGADISVVAPDDIVSIDVLKDAAATAIYGNRAANGVIMITSKKGRRNQLQVSYNGYAGVEKGSSEVDMMNASQLRSFLAKNNLSFLPADDKNADTDWQSEIRRSSAFSHNHNLSLNGGGEHNNYSASINYAKKEGIIIGSDLTRIIARLGLEQYFIDDKVKIGLNLTNSNSVINNVPNRNFALLQSVNHLPVSPVRNPDGTYFENLTTTSYFNPVAIINEAQDNTKSNNLIASLTTQVKLPLGITYDVIVSYQKYTSMHGEYYNSYYTRYNGGSFYNNPDPPVQHTPMNFGTNGSAFRSSYENTNKTLETFFTWDKKIGLHQLNAVLGYSWQSNVNGDGFQTTSTNFTVDGLGYNNLALSNPYGIASYRINFGDGTDYQETRLISDFGRLNYNYSDKYLLQASLRRDGSSVFGDNNQWGYFPAVGAAWRITKEGFMGDQKIFDELKLRASYGVTGNATGFDAYTAQFISGVLGSFYYNGSLVNAYGPVQAANPDLRWEKTATTNLGLDFTLFKGLLSGSIEVYNKKTTGMIYGYAVNPVLIPTGTIIANGGSMSNKGIELSLQSTPVKTAAFSWTTSLNLSHNTNKILSLTNPLFAGGDSVGTTSPGGQGQTGSTLQLLKAGKPLGQFFTFQYAGKDANGMSQFVDGKGGLTTNPQAGVDYHYMGSPQPKLMLGFSNSFTFRNVDLNFFFRGVFGNKIFNVTKADLFRPATAQNFNLPVDAANELSTDQRAYLYSSRFIEDGSYLRLDNATIGYRFKRINKYIKTFRLYLAANNLFVVTGYKGIDPEINQGGLAPGIDANNFYPKTRTILFGVNISL